MLAKGLLLALLVATASSVPVDQDMSVVGYGKAVEMYLQAWKNIMPCGFPEYNIPVMAPLTVDYYPFNYTNGKTDIKGNFKNLRISGLNGFQLLSSSYNDSTMHRTFDIIYPEVQILGSYVVEGTLSIGGFPIPVRHSVILNKKLTDWRFVGEYTFGQSLTNKNGLRINDFDLKYYIAGVKYDNWDKYMDIAANDYFNDIMGSFSLLFSKEIQPYVNQLFSTFALPTINEVLSKMDITQLTNWFVMQAEVWNNAGCTVNV